MERSYHEQTSSSSRRPVEAIPLQTRRRGTGDFQERDNDELDDELDPESDAALLRRHQDLDDETRHDFDTLNVHEPLSIFSRILAIMSKAPLLLRSSPAQITGSYGAVPVSEYDSEVEQGPIDDVRRRDKRKASEDMSRRSTQRGTGTTGRGRHGSASASRSFRRQLRRSSSNASDIGMGPDSKSSFATGSAHPDSEYFREGATPSSRSTSHEDAIDSEESDNEDPPDNSPYPEVRASVPATDNTTISIDTPRMWTLALLFALAGSATNLFFSLRYPSVAITPVIALVVVHPMGLLWDKLLKTANDPKETFDNGVLQQRDLLSESLSGSRNRSFRLWLAQGRWNEKEHACVYISSNVSFGFAFATDVIVEQHKFYKQDVPILYQLLLTISTQILGYAFAGLTRRFLVRPAAMIFPATLMSTAMFTTMHKSENRIADGWSVSRYRFFIYVWAGAFAWYFLPGLLMPALSYFSVITWFAPKNVVVANLFGVASGLGLFPMTFDWAQIAYIGSPLLTPWWAAANVVGGLVIVMWIIAPIMYYKNVLFSSFLPILSSAVFDNTGKPYDVGKILTSDFIFDKVAYENYSRVYLPITYVLSYAVQFASLSALVTHTACWHGKDIWRQTKLAWKERHHDREKTEHESLSEPRPARTKSRTTSLHREPTSSSLAEPSTENMMTSTSDVHNRLMRRYTDVPMSWYAITFLLMLAIGIFVCEYYPIHLPWYGLLLALGLTSVLYIPVGIVMAITNQHSSLYLICQLICGVVFPGRPVANMVFVTYCYISSAQGIKFSSDLKLGHYMKIPPRLLFKVQLTSTLLSSLTQIAVLNWMFVSIPGICTPDAINGFNCPIARVHFNGSILWGVVGPSRFFGPGALYRHLVWSFLVGAIAPIIVYILGRRTKRNIWRKINLPVLFGSLSWIPPATGLNFSVWALVCFLFNYVVRRRKPDWWGKYTMTMSAALDSGLACALVVVFFGFVYPGFMDGFVWWGTEVFKRGCDWTACPYMALRPGEKFGP